MTEWHNPEQAQAQDTPPAETPTPEVAPAPPSYAYAPPTYPAYSPPPPTYRPVFTQPTGYATPTAPAQQSYWTPPTAEPSTTTLDERRSGGRTRTVLIAAVVAAVVGGGIGAGTVVALDSRTRTVQTNIAFSTATAQNSAKIDGSITAAAAKIQPSVVTINVAGSSESGTGSGIILNTDGYIVTNNHVVSVAGTSGQIQVLTSDGQSGTGKIIGTDPSDDLAVIKVDGLKNLTKADFASSAALQVGQSVVAVGAPLGLSNSVTSGIVSNIARPVTTGDSTSTAVFDAIQTDAAINPGNSGGPLVNLNGDVVGINAAIATANSGGVQVPGQQTQQSGSIGIGFAIPSDEAARIAGQLIATGQATHAIIGVTVAADSTSSTSIQTTIGATISAVTAGGAGAKAGLQVGDVVTKVQNQQIITGTDLVAAIRSFAPGQSVSLTFTRSGQSQTVEVTLGTANS